MRNLDNFNHNNNVLKKGEGTLKVKRRAFKNTGSTHKKYKYCLYCNGMFVWNELWRHMRQYKSKLPKTDKATEGRQRVLTTAAVAKSAFSGKTDEEVMRILSKMNEDEIACVMRHDFGFLQFAQSLYISPQISQNKAWIHPPEDPWAWQIHNNITQKMSTCNSGRCHEPSKFYKCYSSS